MGAVLHASFPNAIPYRPRAGSMEGKGREGSQRGNKGKGTGEKEREEARASP